MTKKIINSALYIILFLVPLIIFPTSIFPTSYNIPKIILLYICGITLLFCLIMNYKNLKFDKSDILLLLFLLLIGISTIFSVDVEKSILGQSNRHEGLLTFICYFLTYYSAKYYFKFDKKFIKFSLIVIAITSIIAILQYYDITFISKLLTSERTGKNFSASTFGNRNFFGSFITICTAYSMCLYIFYPKKIYLLISGFAFYGLLVSLTRSAWVAFVVFSLIGFIYLLRKKDKILLKNSLILVLSFIILFLIFIAFKSSNFINKFIGSKETIENLKVVSDIYEDITKKATANNNATSTTSDSKNNVSVANTNSNNTSSTNNHTENNESVTNKPTENQNKSLFNNIFFKDNTTLTIEEQKKLIKYQDTRIVIWQSALKIIKDHPFLGCGPDAYLSELLVNHTEYLTDVLYSRLRSYPDKAHNEFLHIAATIGIPALIVYLVFLLITFIHLIKSNLKENKINFIIFLCLIGYLVQAFFNISTIGVAPIFYFLLGYAYQEKSIFAEITSQKNHILPIEKKD